MSEVVGDLRSAFGTVISYSIPEHVNKVVYCSKSKEDILQGFRNANASLNEELVDLDEAMKQMTMLW